MRTNQYGIPIYSEKDVLEIIYQNKSKILKNILVDFDPKTLNQFNSAAKQLGCPELAEYQEIDIPTVDAVDCILSNSWLMPDEYKSLDIKGFLVNQCPKENYQRVIEEFNEYETRNMLNLLRWLKYFVDTCRKNNVVWGVGRGSSVASYILFLIGVHKIDSVKYNLDWREFLR